MKMNRRNALLGLGAIATGGGALFGSGAFSSVEADRTMTVGFSSDSTAELKLTPTSTYASETSGTGTNSQNVLELSFSNLNDDAVSEFDGVFQVENNDSDGTSHDVYVKNAGDVDGTKVDFLDSSDTSIVGSASANTSAMAAGATESIGVQIDSTNAISSSITVTFVAE